ncbi:TrmH family RNA methyltransferase [Aureimonas jatrophae]|uniref:23S rRNA (Guanosine2251-2'-O)-methyltransferase n=1 Tax=Aureimonas jatrophae TaxID=1166073 RepID=A0A1H0JQV4_9HYPH|nr:RNA methyltransferase [Aureimonas jatrophae]MBB3951290.1 23S rRNA (guanosine2251-2'-O)-methyltransferase [Aureimonas jatrophae]SDO45920.1 23S rRNA (guanosine2251-2'-O)-methyltransferase [Aureimonas jatrophae]
MSDDRPTHTPKDSHYARLRRAHRDAKGDGAPRAARADRAPPKPGRPAPADRVRLYGLHTVEAALGNSKRTCHKLYATRNALARMDLDVQQVRCPVELVEPRFLDTELGSEAVHQGVMLEASPLPSSGLAAIGNARLVLVLDQVTDPHNVGAILRSAVAFGAGAVVTTSRHSPQESGVLAKSASGAMEYVPYVQIGNLADALDTLTNSGFTTIGLDSAGDAILEETFRGDRIALVLGSEGKGLRQKTRETVQALARLEVPGAIRSLNVSNAAAVALYAARRFIA